MVSINGTTFTQTYTGNAAGKTPAGSPDNNVQFGLKVSETIFVINLGDSTNKLNEVVEKLFKNELITLTKFSYENIAALIYQLAAEPKPNPITATADLVTLLNTIASAPDGKRAEILEKFNTNLSNVSTIAGARAAMIKAVTDVFLVPPPTPPATLNIQDTYADGTPPPPPAPETVAITVDALTPRISTLTAKNWPSFFTTLMGKDRDGVVTFLQGTDGLARTDISKPVAATVSMAPPEVVAGPAPQLIERLSTTLRPLGLDAGTITQATSSLATLMDAKTGEKTPLETDLIAKTDQLAKLKADKKSKPKDIKALEKEIATLTTNISALDTEIASLTRQIEILGNMKTWSEDLADDGAVDSKGKEIDIGYCLLALVDTKLPATKAEGEEAIHQPTFAQFKAAYKAVHQYIDKKELGDNIITEVAYNHFALFNPTREYGTADNKMLGFIAFAKMVNSVVEKGIDVKLAGLSADEVTAKYLQADFFVPIDSDAFNTHIEHKVAGAVRVYLQRIPEAKWPEVLREKLNVTGLDKIDDSTLLKNVLEFFPDLATFDTWWTTDLKLPSIKTMLEDLNAVADGDDPKAAIKWDAKSSAESKLALVKKALQAYYLNHARNNAKDGTQGLAELGAELDVEGQLAVMAEFWGEMEQGKLSETDETADPAASAGDTATVNTKYRALLDKLAATRTLAELSAFQGDIRKLEATEQKQYLSALSGLAMETAAATTTTTDIVGLLFLAGDTAIAGIEKNDDLTAKQEKAKVAVLSEIITSLIKENKVGKNNLGVTVVLELQKYADTISSSLTTTEAKFMLHNALIDLYTTTEQYDKVVEQGKAIAVLTINADFFKNVSVWGISDPYKLVDEVIWSIADIEDEATSIARATLLNSLCASRKSAYPNSDLSTYNNLTYGMSGGVKVDHRARYILLAQFGEQLFKADPDKYVEMVQVAISDAAKVEVNSSNPDYALALCQLFPAITKSGNNWQMTVGSTTVQLADQQSGSKTVGSVGDKLNRITYAARDSAGGKRGRQLLSALPVDRGLKWYGTSRNSTFNVFVTRGLGGGMKFVNVDAVLTKNHGLISAELGVAVVAHTGSSIPVELPRG